MEAERNLLCDGALTSTWGISFHPASAKAWKTADPRVSVALSC